MSILERCPSYKESKKGNKQRQGPTLGVRFTEVSVKRESTINPKIWANLQLSGDFTKKLTIEPKSCDPWGSKLEGPKSCKTTEIFRFDRNVDSFFITPVVTRLPPEYTLSEPPFPLIYWHYTLIAH